MSLFDFTQQYSFLAGEKLTLPQNQVVWQDVYNPGHNGDNLVFTSRLSGALLSIYAADPLLMNCYGDYAWSLQYSDLLDSTPSWRSLLSDSGVWGVTTLKFDCTAVQNYIVVNDASKFFSASNGAIIDPLGTPEIITYASKSVGSVYYNGDVLGNIPTRTDVHLAGVPVLQYASSGPLNSILEIDFNEDPITFPVLLRLIVTSSSLDMKLNAVSNALTLRAIGDVS